MIQLSALIGFDFVQRVFGANLGYGGGLYPFEAQCVGCYCFHMLFVYTCRICKWCARLSEGIQVECVLHWPA